MNKYLQDFLILIFGIIIPIFLLIKLLKYETKESKPTARPTNTPGNTSRPTNTPGNTSRPAPTPGNTSRPAPTPGNAMLYSITNKIKSSVDNLKSHSKCQDEQSDNLIKDINNLRAQAFSIISNKDDPPLPSSVEYFGEVDGRTNTIVQTVLQFPKCNCPQGTYTNGVCVCPADYPNQIKSPDGNIYCSNVDCTNINHGKFVPYNGPDPSKNQCVCDDGYAHDDNNFNDKNDPKCYNVSLSNTLKGYADSITSDAGLLKPYIG